MGTARLKVEAHRTEGESEVSAPIDGAVVFLLGDQEPVYAVRFVSEEGKATVKGVRPGIYTVLCVLSYVKGQDLLTGVYGVADVEIGSDNVEKRISLDVSHDDKIDRNSENIRQLEISADVVLGGKTRDADGVVIVVMNAHRSVQAVRFCDGSKPFLIDGLKPGVYTVLCALAYVKGGTFPSNIYSISEVDARSKDVKLDLTLKGPGDKGDLKAIVRVGGVGRNGATVTLDRGSLPKVTIDGGFAVFTGLTGGTYSVTASISMTKSVPVPEVGERVEPFDL